MFFLCLHFLFLSFFFFFNDTPTTEIYTLSLHDALPIYPTMGQSVIGQAVFGGAENNDAPSIGMSGYLSLRSEEHTSELQSHVNLVCRLLLEKKKKKKKTIQYLI